MLLCSDKFVQNRFYLPDRREVEYYADKRNGNFYGRKPGRGKSTSLETL